MNEEEIDYKMNNCMTDLETLICLDKRAIEDLKNNTHEIKQHEILTIIREFIRLKNDYKQLENTDLTTVYMNGFYDGEKKWKDKIKQKIEENEKMTKMKEFNYAVYRYCKNMLEELLKDNN